VDIWELNDEVKPTANSFFQVFMVIFERKIRCHKICPVSWVPDYAPVISKGITGLVLGTTVGWATPSPGNLWTILKERTIFGKFPILLVVEHSNL
jgi:hypothetical protein